MSSTKEQSAGKEKEQNVIVNERAPEAKPSPTLEETVDEEAIMKEYRRTELLAIARKSRLRWILQARERQIEYNSNTNVTNKNSATVSNQSKLEFYKKVPAASCLQEVVDFLVDMTVSDPNEDREYINIETLAPSDNIDDELLEGAYEDLPAFENMNNELSPYSIFLEKLKHSSATEIVNMLRKFVSKVEMHIRDRENYLLQHGSIQPAATAISSSSSSSATAVDKPLDLPQEIIGITQQLEQLFRENILWSTETPSQFSDTMIALEKFLFHKLYPSLFSQILKQNVDKDAALQDRIRSLAFLDPEHLDIVSLKKQSPDREELLLKLMQKLKIKNVDSELVDANNVELNTMHLNMKNMHTEGLKEAVYLLKYSLSSECFSPTDKMNCLRDISQSVIAAISANQIQVAKKKSANISNTPKPSVSANNSNTQSISTPEKKKTPPGADDLLPALILAIKEANPPHLLSTIQYLETYLPPKKLFSEAGYILTHFVSAVQFLEHVNANALTISPLEFEESMYRCKHGGASRLRILQEENEMKEKLLYKKRHLLDKGGGDGDGGDKSLHSKQSSAVVQHSVHDIYKRLNGSRLTATTTPAAADNHSHVHQHHHHRHHHNHHHKQQQQQLNHVIDSQLAKQSQRTLLDAHKAYRGTEKQSQILAAWTQGGNAIGGSSHKDASTRNSTGSVLETETEQIAGAGNGAGLVNYFSVSPDMLTMSDIPRIMAEYKMLVKACVVLSEDGTP